MTSQSFQTFRFPDRSSSSGSVGIDDGFKQIGSGSDDLQSAWAGGYRKIRGRAGATYEVTETLSNEADAEESAIFIDLSHSTIIKAGSGEIMRIVRTWHEAQSVSASTTTTTTVQDGTVYAVGDTLKKVSVGVDLPICTIQDSFKGEFIVVTGISGNILTHNQTMYDYTTGSDVDVQVARISAAQTKLSFGALDRPAVDPGGSGTFVLENCRDVDVRLHLLIASWDTVFTTRSCYGGRTYVGGMKKIEPGGFYVVSSVNDYGLRMEGGASRNLQHAFTAGTGGHANIFTAAGGSQEGVVSGMVSQGPITSGFDWHHGTRGMVLRGNRVSAGPTANCYTARGFDNWVEGCASQGGLRAFTAFIQSTSGYDGTNAWTHRVGTRDCSFVNPITSWFHASEGVGDVYHMGGRHRVTDGATHAIMVDHTNEYTFLGSGMVLEYNGVTTGTNPLIRQNTPGNEIEIDGLNVDLTDSTWADANSRLLTVAAGLRCKVNNLTVINDSSTDLKYFLAGTPTTVGSFFGNINIGYLGTALFVNSDFQPWMIPVANAIVGGIHVYDGAGALDIRPRQRNYTQYITSNAGPQVWTGVTSVSSAAGVYAELADGWFVGQLGATPVTFQRSTDVPAEFSIAMPYSVRATSQAGPTTSMRWTRRLTAAQARASYPNCVIVAWVKAEAGRTITVAMAEPDVVDVFTATTTFDSTSYTATGEWQEVSLGHAMTPTTADNGLEVKIAVDASAAGQDARVAGFGLAKGIVPPLFDAAPYDYDVLLS